MTVFVCAATGGRGLLANIVDALRSDEFSIQREALLAFQNACREGDAVLQQVARDETARALFAQLIGILKVNTDCEASSACLGIFQAAHRLWPTSDGLVLGHCVSIGLMDVLDEIQYGQSTNAEVVRRATELADVLYGAMEEQEAEEDTISPKQETSSSSVFSMGRGQHLAKPAWMDS